MNAMKPGKGKGLSEKQIGYLMVLPALLMITVIAIWPVLRSFWLSMFDIRLNDPARTAVHLNYGLDMERYVETMPALIRVLNKKSAEAAGEALTALTDLKTAAENLQKELNRDPEIAKRYEEIDKLLYDFQPVPEQLKYLEVKKEQAILIKTQLASIQGKIDALSKAKTIEKPEEILGPLQGLRAAMIEPNYLGLTYYKTFFKEPRLWAALFNTFFFTVVSVFIELVLGLWIALLINKQFKGRGLVRAAVLIPWAIPTVISALMWKFMYDGQNGIVARFFETIGLVNDMSVLLTTKWGAMFSVIFADVWKTTPFMALLLFAGLQTIPDSLYESAEVEGASKTQQFFYITLPMLKSTILVALLFRTLDAFRVFDLIYVLTGGGPANSTETISIYAYKTMFAQMNFGAGSALSVIVFLCIAIISLIFIKVLGADLIGDNRGR